MKKTKSQKKRVLEKLKAEGDSGVHSFWGYKNYIPRMGALIYNLKKEGYNIRSERDKEGYGCTYTLEE